MDKCHTYSTVIDLAANFRLSKYILKLVSMMTDSRSDSSPSSEFGDDEKNIPSKENEYDEYYKLRILKLLFLPYWHSFNTFTCSNVQLSIPVFCTIELVKILNKRSIMKRSMRNMRYQKTRKESKSEDVCSKKSVCFLC